ncbi:MAG: hypothetical protein WCK05_09730 [Planctomycetota bacterium]
MTDNTTTFWQRAGKAVLALLALATLGLFLAGCGGDRHHHPRHQFPGQSMPR